MEIIAASFNDIPQILDVLEQGRQIMIQTGNPNQWKQGYPSADMIEQDISDGVFYLVKEGENICGCFAFIIGEDDTYRKIDGAWKSDSLYGTIHRIASNGTQKGVFDAVMRFCVNRCAHIRMDTHQDNVVMRRLMEKYGFVYCGIIYIADGSPRLAYEKLPE